MLQSLLLHAVTVALAAIISFADTIIVVVAAVVACIAARIAIAVTAAVTAVAVAVTSCDC